MDNCIHSPCCSLAEFLHKILSPLFGNTDSFLKNSGKLTKLIRRINIENGDCLASLDVICICTNVPVDKVSEVIRNGLNIDPIPSERSYFQVEHASVKYLSTSTLKKNYVSKENVWH
jgi:hypothetical protein